MPDEGLGVLRRQSLAASELTDRQKARDLQVSHCILLKRLGDVRQAVEHQVLVARVRPQDLNHHTSEELPVLTRRGHGAVQPKIKEGEAELGILHKHKPASATKELDKSCFVNRSALVRELVQKAVLLILLKVQKLDYPQEVSRLEERKEGVQE